MEPISQLAPGISWQKCGRVCNNVQKLAKKSKLINCATFLKRKQKHAKSSNSMQNNATVQKNIQKYATLYETRRGRPG